MIRMPPSLPKLSVCIPAYNRAQYLPPLLDSILTQDYPELEIVICEDVSPERERIAEVVRSYKAGSANCIRYFENERTLGFDGNVRELLKRATGKYCVMMGNDDLLCPGSLGTIGRLLAQHPEAAVVIRSYGWFYETPDEVDQVVRYFKDDRLFPPGEDTAVTFFRRVGVLAGLVFRREDAVAAATDRFDGTLYYQVYLAGELLHRTAGLYVADLIALCRENKPDFGKSDKEKGKFTPGVYTSDARVEMIRSMLEIAEYLDSVHGGSMRKRVLRDLGNYSYYFLAFQANSGFKDFYGYYRALGSLGFDRTPLFHAYFWSLASFGKRNCEGVIKFLRTTLKATPRLGNLSSGTSLTGPKVMEVEK